ncbi:protein CASC3-like isoform X2 [Phymastichus coffea]|uniref:protein CASC3-like isoform X2 n=1 Tax=Phymastichus coffea TaxID=108790 RepID=UPI00273A783E|nr:protein CASC3-like isoform X2 [Phymastichus coffea]
MSDQRRRRKSGGSDDLSDSYNELNVSKETQSSEHTKESHDSEYDTAGSESDAESQERAQRESGDGQEEEIPQKKLDDDEDRRNPQYIPKRGTFYEHDDRTAEEVSKEPVETPAEREVKEKKVWKDKEDRWDHDRYNDEEQAPKSHAELIAVYGYDIRNEEGPPRARRRRRYGRGPNKYTRNWEDEDAYGKAGGNVPAFKNTTRKPNRSGEEFPLLTPKDNDNARKMEDQPVITSAWYSNKNKSHVNKAQNFLALQQTETQKAKSKQFVNSQLTENKTSNERNNMTWKKDPKNTSLIQNANDNSVHSLEAEKIVIVKTTPREIKRPPQVQESISLITNKSRGRGFKANTNNNLPGTRTIESRPKGRGPMAVDNRRVEHEQLTNDMKHLNVSADGPSYHHAARQTKQFYSQPSSQQHSTVVPPRMHQAHPQQQQASPSQQQSPQQPPQQDIVSNRPKRYSSLRQRPAIAEGPSAPAQPNYQPPPQHTYYPPPPQGGSSRAVLETQGYPPSPYEQPTPVAAPAATMPGQPVVPIPQPPTYAPHGPPPFLVPPPQFIPPQTAPPSIINYVPGPNGPIFQPNYQGYNPSPGPPAPQDVGLYQPQGCTYYSPAQQQQQQQQQPVPLRRPKAAIPILPPPDNLQNPGVRVSNRGVHAQQDHQQQLQQEQLVQQQLQQQQQQQEQLVQQQLQQHQQQLIQEQQQELQAQQERQLQQERLLLKEREEKLLKVQQEKILKEQQEKEQQQQLIKQKQQDQTEQKQTVEPSDESLKDDMVYQSVTEQLVEEAIDVDRKVDVEKAVSGASDIKADFEEKLNTGYPEVSFVKSMEEKIVETPIIKELEVEKKDVLSKIKTVIPDVVAAVIDEKTTIEAEIIATSEESKDLPTQTSELVNVKSETDCSVKESTVIEEAAA